MPIVQATDAPYQPFPTGRTSPQAPADYQNIPTEPSMFGALQGQALEKVGAGFEKLGGVLGTEAVRGELLRNQVAADGASNYSQDKANDLLAGLHALKGKEALDAIPGITNDLKKTYLDARNSLENPTQQIAFDRQTRHLLNLQMAEVRRHYDAQQVAHATATNDAQYKLGTQGFAAHADDPVARDAYTKQMMDARLKQLEVTGEINDPGQVTLAIGEVRRDVTAETAAVLGARDAVAAANYVEQNKDVLGVKYPALADHYRARAVDQVARSAANQAVGGTKEGGEPLIPYTPATGLLEGTKLSQQQYDIYRRTTASEESKRYDEPPSANRFGYMGRYQMGGREVAAKRGSEDFNEIAKAAKRLGIPEPTTQEFLSNPKRQEQLFENYTLNNHNELMQRVPQYRDASPDERAAMLMGAHIGGVGGVERFIKSGGKDDPSDGHRSIGDYIRIMRAAQKSGGPAVSVIPHTPTPGTEGAVGQPPPAAGPAITGPGGAAPALPENPAGLVAPGNIDVVKNPDLPGAGTINFSEDGKTVLIPLGGRNQAQAIAQYKKTGQNFGKFDTADNALSYAQAMAIAVGRANQATAAPGTVPGAPVGAPPAAVTPPGAPPAPTIPPPAPEPPAPKSLAQIEEDAKNNATAAARAANFDPTATQQAIDSAISHARTTYNNSTTAVRQAEQNNLTIAQAQVTAGNNGEPFHDHSEYMADAGRAQLYNGLSPQHQKTIRDWIENAATKRPLTPERLARYEQLKGMSQESPDQFLQVDVLKEDLPRNMINQLITRRNEINKGVLAPPDVTKAMTVLQNHGLFEGTGIDKTNNPPRYHQYYSALSDAIQQFKTDKKRAPNNEEILGIGNDLMKVAVPGALWGLFAPTRQYQTIIPNTERDAIVKGYQTATGKTPTPNEILRIYHEQQTRKAASGERTVPVPPAAQPEGMSP